MSIRFKSHRVCILATICFILPFITSCTYKYLGPEEPETIYGPPCPNQTERQAQFHSFSVMVMALNHAQWKIISVDRKNFSIIAQVKDPAWTRAKVNVKPGGLVVIQRTDPEDIGRNAFRRWRHWMKYLKRAFSEKYRCYPVKRHPKK